MRADTIDFPSPQSDQRNIQAPATDENLLTPARRAALDALEREFQDLLQLAAH